MSPISNFAVLALASTALAVPLAGEQHRHLHARQRQVQDLRTLPNNPVDPNAVAANPVDPNAVGANPVIDNPVTGGSGGGVFSGKRGVAYNDASLTLPFAGSSLFGWGHNWVSSSDGLAQSFSYIPTLHNGDSTFTSNWANEAQAAISAGSKYLFGFNEPDIVSQANMKPDVAAAAWRKYMEPFAGKATLVAPAVSNSNNPGEGLDWLKQFLELCSDCNIGAVNQHWYDTSSNDINLFKQQISDAHSATGLPVFVGEFGFIGDDNQISEALNQVMGWMDGEESIIGYAYFMVADGFLNNGGSLSPYGQTYLNN